MRYKEFYNATTEFAAKFKCHQFNDEENHREYMKLVDLCIKCGTMPECSREDFSTQGELIAAITYEFVRYRFCL